MIILPPEPEPQPPPPPLPSICLPSFGPPPMCSEAPEYHNGSFPTPTPTDFCYWTHTEELKKAYANITSR